MESSALVYVVLTVVTLGLALYIDNWDNVSVYISGRCPTAAEYAGKSRQQVRNIVAETGIYCLLAGVSACRIAVGNDYWVYRDNFKLIAQGRHVSSEAGFNLIVRGMQELFGYDNYIPVFALFSLVTVFFFMKAMHDQGVHYAFSFFLLMTGGYYFNSLNSVRYYLALGIALYSMKYVLRGEYGKFVLWIAAGAAFHKSVLLVLLVYPAAKLLAGIQLKRRHYVLGGIFLLSLIFGQELYRKIIFFFYPFYENSAFDNGQLSYANIAKCLGTLLLCIVCRKGGLKENKTLRFYCFLNLFGLVAFCCGFFVPEVSRVGYYMIAAQIFLLPGLLAEMNNGWLKRLCYIGVVIAFALYFVVMLYKMYAVDVRLLPYLNWIFN